MPQPIRRTRLSRAQWQALVDEFQSGDLTVEAFCRKRQLPDHRFKWWQSRLGGASPQIRPVNSGVDAKESPWFAELSVDSHAATEVAPSHASAWDVELTLGPGMILRVRRGQPC